MKKTVFILLFVLMAQMGISQILKVENGISISSLNKDFDHKIRPYQFMMDVEYCDKGWFNISSGIGKLTKGGSRGIPITTEDGYTSYGNINLYVDYLTLNSTFDVKYVKNKFVLYLGAGPRIDIKLKTRYTHSIDELSPLADGGTVNLIYGINCICGVRYLINRVQLGLNAGYLSSFNEMYTGLDKKKVSDKTFTVGVSVGYKL